MRRLGWVLGRLLLILLALIAGVWAFAPRELVERGPAVRPDMADPAGWLAAREAALGDVVPGTEARIIWAGAEGAPTETVVVYLHGFSATSEEIRPVPDRVAEDLGANLLFVRLPGHGRGGAAMAEPRAGDWLDDVAAMLEIARGLGDRIVVIGTSTGATLASWAATDPAMSEGLAALVLISPNYTLANPAGVLLEWPLARHWVPLVVGRDRQFEPANEDHARYWTTGYPSVSAVTLGTLLREARNRDYGVATLPALFLFAETDQVISAPAVRDFAAGWGGPVQLVAMTVPEVGGDAYHHVIAGEIMSPALTDEAVVEITSWLSTTLP